MKQEARNRESLVQYLLGELSEEDKSRLEQEYFGDDDFFEQLLIVEGELIDAYVRGELSGRGREQFEARFLASPGQRQRVEIARALVEYATRSSMAVSPAAERQKPITRWQSLINVLGAKNHSIMPALAAAVLLIVVGGSLLIVETVRLRNRVELIQDERAEILKREQELEQQLAEQGANNERLAEELQRERSQRELLEQEMAKPQRSTLSTITFILTYGLVRGAGDPKRLTIPQGTDRVRINLDFEKGDYKSYRARLETVDGKRIWNSSSLAARSSKSGKIVALELPANLFATGDYILTLSGVNTGGNVEPVGEYYFNVLKK